MFTSRSEFRMSARADNADLRLTAKGREAGVISDRRWSAFNDEKAQMEELQAVLESRNFSSSEWNAEGFNVRNDSIKRSAFGILRHSDISLSQLEDLVPEIRQYPARVRARLDIEGAYAPYIVAQENAAASFARDERLRLPPDLDYQAVHGLSWEEKKILSETRPENLGQARRVEGVTPSGALTLLGYVRHAGRRAAKRDRLPAMVKDTVEASLPGNEVETLA
jgi:tRNA uridine 5-carboxymethylaminomethyl modification enzyme